MYLRHSSGLRFRVSRVHAAAINDAGRQSHRLASPLPVAICASSEDLRNWPGVAHKRWSASAANGRPIRLAVDEWLQHAARGSETRHLEVRFFRGDSNGNYV
jgi:hypothetical protein